MEKKTIICIVGESGSGKTTLSRYMAERGFGLVCSYTTRVMRPGETDGVEHIFVSEDEMPEKNQMIAYTYFGGHHYWATISQISEDNTIYVIDEDGIRFLRSKFSDMFNIFAVYIRRDDRGDIDADRKGRDCCRTLLDESEYDLIINNEGCLDSFLEDATEKITDALLKKHKS